MWRDRESAVHSLLEEGLDDWVPIDRLIDAAREIEAASTVSYHTVASDLLMALVGGGLMIPGDIGDNGFQPWVGTPSRLIERIVAECENLHWRPQLGGCWLANTRRGDDLASHRR